MEVDSWVAEGPNFRFLLGMMEGKPVQVAALDVISSLVLLLIVWPSTMNFSSSSCLGLCSFFFLELLEDWEI